jgi:hypothetical protein
MISKRTKFKFPGLSENFYETKLLYMDFAQLKKQLIAIPNTDLFLHVVESTKILKKLLQEFNYI